MTTYHMPIVNILSILTSIILTSDREILLLGKRKGVPEIRILPTINYLVSGRAWD